MSDRAVTVLVDDAHAGAIEQVAQACAGAGLRVGEVLTGVGVITGTVPDGLQLPALEALEGVSAVEFAQEIQLPPPDSPVQ